MSPIKVKHLSNDFFTWMDGIYDKKDLLKSTGGIDLERWDVYWHNDPKSFYGYSSYIFWKTISGKIGYDYFYYYAYDDTQIHSTYGPFESLAELKEDYLKEGGDNMPFPDLDYDSEKK